MPGINEIDLKASSWDENPVHHARSEAIAKKILTLLPFKKEMDAMEYGAGTGILSFMLKDYFNEILLMDSSKEMINVINKKIDAGGVKNLKTIVFDLEHLILQGIEVIRGCSGIADDVVKLYITGLVKDSGSSCHQHESHDLNGDQCGHN